MLTNEELHEIRGSAFALKSMTESEQIQIIDELLTIRSLRDAGDDEIYGRAGEVKKWTDLLLKQYIWQHLNIKGQVLVQDVATFTKEIADFAIARGQQLREAREEIERLDQVVQKLKDNFGEMEVGP